jgi:hypothetical protein
MRTLLVAIVALGSLAACKSHQPVHPEGAAVRIKTDHYHTKFCGHYVFGTQWYYLSQHKHGVDCGHELVGDNWTLVQE